MYIFGYGSLLWYTNFPYEESIEGHVKDFVRRFWQASPDHRGTPDKPGRTVTLVPEDGSECWGLAYKVSDEHADEVRKYLNWREKAGYEVHKVMFYPYSTKLEPFELEIYISPPYAENQFFTGPESIEDIADKVVKCIGPSGTNVEYVLRVASSVRSLYPSVNEPHLFELETAVVKLCVERQIMDRVLIELGHVVK